MDALLGTFIAQYPVTEQFAVRSALATLGFVLARKKLRLHNTHSLPSVADIERLVAVEDAFVVLGAIYSDCKSECRERGEKVVVQVGAVRQHLKRILLDTTTPRAECELLTCVSLHRTLQQYHDNEVVDWKTLKEICAPQPTSKSFVESEVSPIRQFIAQKDSQKKRCATLTPSARTALGQRSMDDEGTVESVYTILSQGGQRGGQGRASPYRQVASPSSPPPPPPSSDKSRPDKRNIAVSSQNEFAKAMSGVAVSASTIQRSHTSAARKAVSSQPIPRSSSAPKKPDSGVRRGGAGLFTPEAFKKKEIAVPEEGPWERPSGFLFTPDAFADETRRSVVSERMGVNISTRRQVAADKRSWQQSRKGRRTPEVSPPLLSSTPLVSPAPLVGQRQHQSPIRHTRTPQPEFEREKEREKERESARLKYHRKIQSPAVPLQAVSSVVESGRTTTATSTMATIPSEQLKELVKGVLDELGVSPVRLEGRGVALPPPPPPPPPPPLSYSPNETAKQAPEDVKVKTPCVEKEEEEAVAEEPVVPSDLETQRGADAASPVLTEPCLQDDSSVLVTADVVASDGGSFWAETQEGGGGEGGAVQVVSSQVTVTEVLEVAEIVTSHTEEEVTLQVN